MNIDSGFFYALLQKGNPQPLTQIDKEWLAESWQPVYDFVIACLNSPNMRKLPTCETVSEKFSVAFYPNQEDVGLFMNALRERKATQVLETGVRDSFLPLLTNDDRKQNDPIAAAANLMNLGALVRRRYRARRQGDFIDYNSDIAIRQQDYADRAAKNGMMGVPFPFEPMNIATGGMIAGEATALFGESGVGKTWLLLLCAAHAIKLGYSVALFSNEMQPRRLSIRLDALLANLSPEKFRRGILDVNEQRQLSAYYAALPARKNTFLIFGPSDVSNLASFESVMSIIRSDIQLVLWDSPYLCIRSESWEEKSVFVQDLKNMAEDYAIPIVMTWQLNRKGEVALTSAITQDLDHNFILGRDAQMKDLAQAKLWSIKTRDGLELEEMLLQWNVKDGIFNVLSWKIPGVGTSTQDYRVQM